MKDFWQDNIDKFLIVALIVFFGISAVHGAGFAQRICDALIGALTALAVQKYRGQTPPHA